MDINDLLKEKYAEDYYDTENRLSCPVCGSYNVQSKTTYDQTDADGNRGRWMTSLKCLEPNCRYEG
jgi:formate dehydrogenase maturation protein FdhE